jgi:hypothetical protein
MANDFTRRNKIGLALTALIALTNLPSPLLFDPSDAENGPPMAVLWLDTVCGVVMLAALVVAWRTGSRGAVRLAAGFNIVQGVTTLPAFFVDINPGIKVVEAVAVTLAVVSVVLSLSPARRAVPVLD